MAVAADLDQRLGLVALRVGRDGRGEREPLRVGADGSDAVAERATVSTVSVPW